MQRNFENEHRFLLATAEFQQKWWREQPGIDNSITKDVGRISYMEETDFDFMYIP
jgi:hypothetical protein